MKIILHGKGTSLKNRNLKKFNLCNILLIFADDDQSFSETEKKEIDIFMLSQKLRKLGKS